MENQGIIDCPSHLLMLDLGAGQRGENGFQTVDYSSVQSDWHVDLFRYPWPWDSESVFKLRASHFIEHVPDLIPFMNEAYRVLCDRGTFEIIAPYLTNFRAFQDPTHKNFLSENSFLYYDQTWLIANKLEHYPIKTNFKTIQLTYFYDAQYQCLSDQAKEYARLHYWNTALDMKITLQKHKVEC